MSGMKNCAVHRSATASSCECCMPARQLLYICAFLRTSAAVFSASSRSSRLLAAYSFACSSGSKVKAARRALLLVALLEERRDFLVVAGYGCKGVIGNASSRTVGSSTPIRLLPQRIRWSRKLSGLPAQWPSSHSATLHRSTASGFKSTP